MTPPFEGDFQPAPVQPTPEPDTGGEAEALAAVIYNGSERFAEDGVDWENNYVRTEWRNLASAVLASDWLADRLAEARAEALREAADGVHSRFEHSLLNTQECEWVENWLRDRAARTAPLQDAEEVGE